MEGWADYTDADGERFAFVIDGLALLGATPPGISSIRSLRDLPQALGVAASARIVASFGDTQTLAIGGGRTERNEPKTRRPEPHDPAKIREALGLAADASPDEVRADW